MPDANAVEEFEPYVLAFERAWQDGIPPAIEAFLPPDWSAAEQLRLLTELVCVDLEFRWRRAAQCAEPPAFLLEDYVRLFPVLGSPDDLPLDLVAEEYRVRRLWGDRPSHDRFLTRFGEGRERIRGLLRQVDAELHDEADETPEATVVARTRTGPLEGLDGSPDPRAPLAYADYVLQRLIGSSNSSVWRMRSLGTSSR